MSGQESESAANGMPPEGSPRPSSRRAWVIGLSLACLLVAVGYFAVHRPGPAQPGRAGAQTAPRPVPVVTVTARSGDLPVYLAAVGTVTSLNTVTVRSRVDGQLLRTLFREGQTVRAGELLAEIDPRPFQAQLTQAEGQLARDQAALANAHLDLERYRQLVAGGFIARQQLDTQVSAVAQGEGAIKADQGQIDSIKVQLTYCRILAPITGRVGLRLVDPGNMVHANDAGGMVVLTQMEPIAVVFPIPEDSLPPVLKRLRASTPITVDAYDREGRTKLASGTLLAVDSQIDPGTGTVRIKASFANTDGALYPNQFVNARVLVDVLHDAVLVPVEAIQRGAQGPFVYVVRANRTTELRNVTVGPSEGGLTVVRGGVGAGEAVVVEGADKVQQHARVEPTSREASGARPGQ
jgi:multidrug efflux system membrane fusion protein